MISPTVGRPALLVPLKLIAITGLDGGARVARADLCTAQPREVFARRVDLHAALDLHRSAVLLDGLAEVRSHRRHGPDSQRCDALTTVDEIGRCGLLLASKSDGAERTV